MRSVDKNPGSAPHERLGLPRAVRISGADTFPPLLLTVPEVAEILRTTNKAVYAMVERGQLDGAVRRIKRRVLFDQAALVAWLAELSGAPSPEGDRR